MAYTWLSLRPPLLEAVFTHATSYGENGTLRKPMTMTTMTMIKALCRCFRRRELLLDADMSDVLTVRIAGYHGRYQELSVRSFPAISCCRQTAHKSSAPSFGDCSTPQHITLPRCLRPALLSFQVAELAATRRSSVS